MRTAVPSTTSSTRVTPVESVAVDYTATSSPSWNWLPLGGETITTLGLLTGSTLHASNVEMTRLHASKNKMNEPGIR
jgi:hypothetical protein